jgi:hypothetical protein
VIPPIDPAAVCRAVELGHAWKDEARRYGVGVSELHRAVRAWLGDGVPMPAPPGKGAMRTSRARLARTSHEDVGAALRAFGLTL